MTDEQQSTLFPTDATNRILALEPFDEAVYSDIDLNRLAVYGVHQLNEMDIPITFERVVVLLYRLFPAKFSMAEFRSFPDATRVNRAILQLRPKYRNWARGSIKEGYFALTQDGRAVLEQTQSLLSRGQDELQKEADRRHVPFSGEKRDIGMRFMAEIEGSSLFECYQNDRLEQASTWNFYDLLHVSEETDRAIMEANLRRLESYATGLCREDILDFLRWIRERFHEYLID